MNGKYLEDHIKAYSSTGDVESFEKLLSLCDELIKGLAQRPNPDTRRLLPVMLAERAKVLNTLRCAKKVEQVLKDTLGNANILPT